MGLIIDPYRFALPSTPQTTGDPTTNASGFQSNTWFSTYLLLTNGNNIQKIGIYSGTAGTFTLKIAQQTSAGNYTVVATESVSHGGAGWQDFTLTTPYLIPGSGNYYAGMYVPGAQVMGYRTSGASRAYKAGDIGLGASGSWSEDSAAGLCIRVNQGL